MLINIIISILDSLKITTIMDRDRLFLIMVKSIKEVLVEVLGKVRG